MDKGNEHRSGCPINLAVEVMGDRWSLVVLRDVMFGDRHYFRELLAGSQEGIASNILADRLRRLVANGLLWQADDPSHKQKIRYSLTEAGVQLVPVMAALGSWGRRHMPASHELSVRAELLERGGPELWGRFMDELREQHLGVPRPPGTPSVFAELQTAYEKAVAETNGGN
ncbi:helix-turn-helix transcriptional regulator [Actinoplanes sp. LDG1-06]|uniref:Helix-turn-helix transcriptional regulator n=1 Tax=Paractinoplanes ovalisporus TaxID=2810368 RepID=A0ABS2AU94_9ACTN|nr:helix-turn-helix domain-containing protein [Actinoplanes ovalisporus]MBM2622943.1 helix-turn-helix transcriptional regulator [Actinoplanes ovalisporus]